MGKAKTYSLMFSNYNQERVNHDNYEKKKTFSVKYCLKCRRTWEYKPKLKYGNSTRVYTLVPVFYKELPTIGLEREECPECANAE